MGTILSRKVRRVIREFETERHKSECITAVFTQDLPDHVTCQKGNIKKILNYCQKVGGGTKYSLNISIFKVTVVVPALFCIS